MDRLEIEENIAHIFRLSDAFSVDKVFILKSERSINWQKVKKISRQCTEQVRYEVIESIDQIDKDMYYKVAVEWTDESKSVIEYSLAKVPILLVAGNEKHGCSQKILDWCDDSIHIDMYGQNSSMNVAMAAGIVVHSIRSKSAPRK